ncbi:hypothetical protein Leryth_022181 [Lithospermum erythrorhizon]|nr:hypothetical protein Leryth_022181 [Lithospermum erythrorhizon]
MQDRAKVNAMRSLVVVIGAVAFGYLNFHLGFKPFLEKAAQQEQNQPQLPEEPTKNQQQDFDDQILR